MKYCLDFKKTSPYMAEVDELSINFKDNFQALVSFLKKRPDKRINIIIADKDELTPAQRGKMAEIIQKFPNAYLCYTFLKADSERLLPQGRTFYSRFAKTWDDVFNYIDAKVSDVYVAEELCFDIVRVSSLLHSHNIQVRAYPNVCQTSCKTVDKLKTFFIRPEDVPYYEPYIDVLEFFFDKYSQDALYKIYALDGKWPGNLNTIIIGFDKSLNNQFFPSDPAFATTRTNCQRNCLKGGNCRVCDKFYALAENLSEHKIIIKRRKE